MIRLIAMDPTGVLDDTQVLRIQSCLLEFIPATGCRVSRDPTVHVTITGHASPDLHPPLLHRVEAIAGFRFRVEYSPG